MKVFDQRLEQLEGFETDYVKILYYDLPKKFSGTYKTYHYTRFCTILEGEKHVTLGNDTFTYGESSYLLLPPQTTLKMDMDIDTRALVFELNDDLIENVLDKIEVEEGILDSIKDDQHYFLGEHKSDIYHDMCNLYETSIMNKKNKEFLIDLYAQKLVFNLIQDKKARHILQHNDEGPMNIALKYINQNIHNPINIGELSKQLYMSESNFSYLFKKNTGLTPGEYIKNRKLELSAAYLKNSNVTDVAYDLGYNNLSYFIKIFKEKYALTPKQYKLAYYS